MHNAVVYRHRGAAAVLAMIFLVILGIIAFASYWISSNNLRMSRNFSEVEQARVAAESGIRFFTSRLNSLRSSFPRPYSGRITSELAWNELWVDPNNTTQGIAPVIKAAFGDSASYVNTSTDHRLFIEGFRLTDNRPSSPHFDLDVVQDPADARILVVTCTGQAGDPDRPATRTVRMQFWIDKHINSAVTSWVPPQLGKNSIIIGNTVLNTRYRKRTEGTVLLSLSDFRDLSNSGADAMFAEFQTFLRNNYSGRDNCIRRQTVSADLWDAAVSAVGDLNGDNMINEYDVFIKAYDRNYDPLAIDPLFGPRLTKNDYGNNLGDDADLFEAMDSLARDLYTFDNGDFNHDGTVDKKDQKDFRKDKNVSPGKFDDYIDNLDGYAKILGQLRIVNDGELIDPLPREKFHGPVFDPDNPMAPGVLVLPKPADSEPDVSETILDPQTYKGVADRLKTLSGPNAGTPAIDPVHQKISNQVLSTDLLEYSSKRNTLGAVNGGFKHELIQITDRGDTGFTNGQIVTQQQFDTENKKMTGGKKKAVYTIDGKWDGNWSFEKTPWGSTTSQGIYKRPVFRNMHFENVTIPEGLNAVFVDCTFEGVTFVQLDENISFKAVGENQVPDTWPWIRTKTTGGGQANTGTQAQLPNPDVAPTSAMSNDVRTNGSTKGNNLRFEGCTFTGPLASDVPNAYTHAANSWEFTGDTVIDTQWKDPSTGETSVSILAPQTNIEMGSYEDGKENLVKLRGVVVAGNIDIRGKGWIDGALINTGNAAGSMTLGYFGDNDSTVSLTPETLRRAGRLIMRYNQALALPDGIDIPVSITPDPTTYLEVLNVPQE